MKDKGGENWSSWARLIYPLGIVVTCLVARTFFRIYENVYFFIYLY